METVQFTACKHLDYSDSYASKKHLISLGETKVCWDRPVIDESYPRLVQFCKLHGRMNHPEECTSKKKAACGNYQDFRHEVDLSTIFT